MKTNMCETCDLPILYVDKYKNLIEIHMNNEIYKVKHLEGNMKTILTRREGIQLIVKEVPKALLNQFLWEESIQWLYMIDSILCYKTFFE